MLNRYWMLSTFFLGSFIVLRNINVTLKLFNAGRKDGFKEDVILFGAPTDAVAPRLRRALLEDNSHLDYRFIYFDEESLSRERALYRNEDSGLLQTTNVLFELANKILEYPFGASLESSKSVLPDSNEVVTLQKNVTVLGLAYFLTGLDEYAEKAVYLIRQWFLSPTTRITPQHLYISALKIQLHSFLDSLQMVLGHLEDQEIIQLQKWFLRYLEYTGDIFHTKLLTTHSSALYFDIEQLSVANFVGDEILQAEIFKRVLNRLPLQIEKDGSLPQDLKNSNCEHSQMFTLQGWWTLARLFSNAMGETLWTADDGAMCRASEIAVPYLKDRQRCGSMEENENDQRWWPIIVDTLQNCQNLNSTKLHWREWMTPASKDVPLNLYKMPPVYEDMSGITLFWNLGMPVKKELTDDATVETPVEDAKNDIPVKLLRAAEHDSQMSQRVHRIKRWKELGQKEIAERMTVKALNDLRSTKILSTGDYIPSLMLNAAKTDENMNQRISRIRRWHGLAQHSIVERMIKKSMDELKQKAEDNEVVKVLEKRREQDSLVKSKESSSITLPSSKIDSAAENKPRKTSSIEIPNVFIKQAKTDPEMGRRIHRIQRWKRLNQHEIADKMIKKLLASTEDQTF